MRSPPHLVLDAILSICTYLPGPDRFLLATLYRHSRTQALALFSIPSASLVAASGRGLVDLLAFRVEHATIRIGSIAAPLDAILWTLHSRTVRRSDGSELRLEWWDIDAMPSGSSAFAGSPNEAYLATVHAALLRGGGACHIHVFAWWRTQLKSPGFPMSPMSGAVQSACENGYVAILQWCRDHCLDLFEIEPSAVSAAAEANHAGVVRWCEANGVPLESIMEADFADEDLQLRHLERRRRLGAAVGTLGLQTLRVACKYGQLRVLQWLRDNNVVTSWEGLVALANAHGNVEVLRWWRMMSDSRVCISSRYACEAYGRGQAELLEFWWDCGVERRPTRLNFLDAATNGNSAVFEMLLKSGFTPDGEALVGIIERAFEHNHPTLLQWLHSNGFRLELTERMAELACHCGSVEVLEWWKNSGIPFVFDASPSKRGVMHRSRRCHRLLKWWENSGFDVALPTNVDVASILSAPGHDKVDALQWWYEQEASQKTGLLFKASEHGVINSMSTTRTSAMRCTNCHTTTTPLWRKGPLGPNSLCNACGSKWKHGKMPRWNLQDLEWFRRNGLEMPAVWLNSGAPQMKRFVVEANHYLKRLRQVTQMLRVC